MNRRAGEPSGRDHEGGRCLRSAIAACGNGALLRYRLVLHASVLKHVGPLAAGARVAVFQVLAKMVCAEELLRLIALAEFVHVVQMLGAHLPAWRVGELLATVAAHVRTTAGHGLVKGGFRAGEGCARPGMQTQVEGVLVAFGFVLVFEPVRAVSAAILFLRLVQPVD